MEQTDLFFLNYVCKVLMGSKMRSFSVGCKGEMAMAREGSFVEEVAEALERKRALDMTGVQCSGAHSRCSRHIPV